jgi:deoxyribonucleoside regulator
MYSKKYLTGNAPEGIDEDRAFMARVAWLYYEEGLTQQQIAKRLGITRLRVNKLLSNARKEGVVQIRIVGPMAGCFALETKLKTEFGLQNCIIVPTPDDPLMIRDMIGIACANYLTKSLTSGDVLGTAWGSTVFDVARHLKSMEIDNFSVVSLLGGLTNDPPSLNPFDIAKTVADKCGGKCYYLFAPSIVDSREIRDAIMSDGRFRSTFEIAQKASKALLGIGEATEDAILVKTGFINASKMAELRLKGAVGDLLGRFFDIDGRLIADDINDKVIGLSLEDIRTIDVVIGVAGGSSKIRPILGALRGRHINVLITDEVTAQAVLDANAKL